MSPDDPRHGTTRGFHAGCRDQCCRAAIARYEKESRLARLRGGRSVSALGSQRRIRALMCLGWTSTDIAAAAGWGHRNYVLRILHGQKGKPTTWLERKTHDVIAKVYDDLSMRLPERTPCRARTATLASRRSWSPPLAYDDIDDPTETPRSTRYVASRPHDEVDEVVLERYMAGDHSLRLTRAERPELVRRWVAAGRSLGALERLGWKPSRYIEREEGAA